MKRYPVLLLATLTLSPLAFAQTAAVVPAADTATQSITASPDPSAAVAAYAAAARQVGPNNLALEDAYVHRMVTFNLPDLADAQAQDVVKQDPNNAVARAVVAYVQGRKNQPLDALATIVQAAAPQPNLPDEKIDPFVLRTAGQLIAWYDTRADKTQVAEPLKQDLESTRRRLFPQAAYIEAYNSARDLYEGKSPDDQQSTTRTTTIGIPNRTYNNGSTTSANTAPAPAATGDAPVTYVPPPVTYDDGYAYTTYPTSTYYYEPYYPATYYWTPSYNRFGYRSYNPGYYPPVIIPDHRRHDWDHGHDWNHGRDWDHGRDHDGNNHDHDGNNGHDGHDGGNHESHTAPMPGSGWHRIDNPIDTSPRRVNIPDSNAHTFQQSQIPTPRQSEPTVIRRSEAPAPRIEAPARVQAPAPAAPVRSAPAPSPRSGGSPGGDGGGTPSHSSRGTAGSRAH